MGAEPEALRPLREPVGSPGRPSGEMMPRTPLPDAGSHATHDRLAVAALAAGDLSGTDQIHASALVATCEACGNLLAEIRTIAAATRGLPAPVRVAARDFRISPDQASSLARGAGWRRILRPFGRQGYVAIRPFAAMFSTLGVAGLLLAALPLLPFAGGTASMDTVGGGAQVREAPTAANPRPEARPPEAAGVDASDGKYLGANLDGAGSGPTDGAGTPPIEAGAPGPTERAVIGPTEDQADGPSQPLETTQSTDPPAPLLLVSLVFLSAGLGLFLLQRAARRLR